MEDFGENRTNLHLMNNNTGQRCFHDIISALGVLENWSQAQPRISFYFAMEADMSDSRGGLSILWAGLSLQSVFGPVQLSCWGQFGISLLFLSGAVT